MKVTYKPTRHGKSVAAARARDAAIRAGKKVALVSAGADGDVHVCVVQSISRGRRRSG